MTIPCHSAKKNKCICAFIICKDVLSHITTSMGIEDTFQLEDISQIVLYALYSVALLY